MLSKISSVFGCYIFTFEIIFEFMNISKTLIFILLLINLSVSKAQNIYIEKDQGKSTVKKTNENLKIDNLLSEAITLQGIDIVKAKAKCDEAYRLLKKSNYSNGVLQYYLVKSYECLLLNELNKGVYFARKAQKTASLLNNYKKHIKGCAYEAACLEPMSSDYNKTIKYINRKLDSIKALKHYKECEEIGDLYLQLGVPNFLKAEMVKDDVVIIDVGITRVEDETTEKGYRIVGDVDFENVSKKASYITPVPGGVGPMTIAMLLKNTLLAREQKRNR